MRPDDAPLLKTLLLLLHSRFFEGSYLGDRERRELGAWDSIIRAALGEELEHRGLREGLMVMRVVLVLLILVL